MIRITTECLTAASTVVQELMPHEIALGAAGGSFSTLVLALVRELISSEHIPPLPVEITECLCGENNLLREILEHPKLSWFLIGVIVGCFIGVILDLALVIREKWRRFVASHLAPPGAQSRSLYKILHE